MKCPGQDSRFWQSNAIYDVKCPKCGHSVEFFKDETKRTCPQCGHKFVNPKLDFGCAAYCRFAEQCLGNLPPEVLAERENLLKDRVAIEMKKYFKRDFRRISHATKVARYAEELLFEEGADPAVVLVAAFLHDIGLAGTPHSFDNKPQGDHEKESATIARNILEKLGARDTLIDEVCEIISHHHHPAEQESINFKVLFDADLITNLQEAVHHDRLTGEKAKERALLSCLTESGKEKARNLFS